MAIDLVPYVLEFFARYGLIAMVVLLTIDGAMLNPLIPGEAVMIMAVAQYAETTTDLVPLIGIATAAAIGGAVILYGLSRVGGRPLVDKHPRLFMMDRRKREKMEEMFERPSGESLVCLLRLIPLTRVVVSIPAGIARMKFWRFLVLTTIGMLVWHSGFMYLAFKFQQPGSELASQAAVLQEAYASPAWQYLQTNEALAVIAALLIGCWLSFKSSRRMLKYPRGTVYSLMGWLTVRVLVLGSMAVAGLLYYDPSIVYDVALAGGLDVPEIAKQAGLEPVRMLAYSALGAWSIGVLLWGLEAGARRRQARIEEQEPDPGEREEELSTGDISFRDLTD